MLPVTYPYIGFVELRPVAVEILRRCQNIPIPLLQSLTEQLPNLQIKVPVEVMQQVWKFSDKSFIEAISPVIRVYILQSASAWSVRAAQQEQKTRIEEYEQYMLRTSSIHMATMGEAVAQNFSHHDLIAPSDLDLRQAWLSLSSVSISNPSPEILRILQHESQSLGASRSAFQAFVDAAASANSDSHIMAELITATTTKWEGQLKAITQTNSYSAFANRDFNIPLQLLTDYIGDHPSLYSSTIKYIRKLMAEIQSYQLKLRPGIDFDRSFPLLSSLGLLRLFTVYASDSNLPGNDSFSKPIAIDPSLGQILGSLRFDLLMAQHDRSHTSLCEQDELYRYAWCMDAVRREKTFEQRHFDEMEEIWTLMQSQLAPLTKFASSTSSSTSSSNNASSTRSSGAKKTAESNAKASPASTRVTLMAKKTTRSSGNDTTEEKRIRPKRASASASVKKEEEENEEEWERAPMSRRERTAAARSVIKQALADDEYRDDEEEEYGGAEDEDEEKKTLTRARPTRRTAKRGPDAKTKSTASYSTMEEGESDEEYGGAAGKPKRKRTKRTRTTDDDYDSPPPSDEDSADDYFEEEDNASDKANEDDVYVDEDATDDEDEPIDEDEDYDDLIDDDTGKSRSKKRKPRAKKSNAAGTAKAKTNKFATDSSSVPSSAFAASSSSSSGGLKVTLTGLTGTSTLASQARDAKTSKNSKNVPPSSSSSSSIASSSVTASNVGGIKLKRGNQVLVDTAIAQDVKPALLLAASVSQGELESRINLLAECSWITSIGSLQMTIQTMLHTILKEVAQKHTRPASVANCDPKSDIDAIKKVIVSDKRISRLINLLQLGFCNFPVLLLEGLDSAAIVGILAERVIESNILQHLLSNHLSSISTKPWTRAKVDPSSLSPIDRTINLLSCITLLNAYFDRYSSRCASKEQIKSGGDEYLIEQEEKRLSSMFSKSFRHQYASGDLAPNIRLMITHALLGTDEKFDEEDGEAQEEDILNVPIPNVSHPDAALSMVLFWSLTQAGSANEDVAREISSWVTSDTRIWKSQNSSSSPWPLLSYSTFIQELLFGFARAGMSSPVLPLRSIMIDDTLANVDEGMPNLFSSHFGTLQLLSYLYLALCHGSISPEEAQVLLTKTMEKTLPIDPKLAYSYLLDSLRLAIDPMLITHIDPTAEGAVDYAEHHQEEHVE